MENYRIACFGIRDGNPSLRDDPNRSVVLDLSSIHSAMWDNACYSRLLVGAESTIEIAWILP
jgi:hypothetical protein